MSSPSRTTIVYALTGGFLVVPAAIFASTYLPQTIALKLALWTDLAVYTVLLIRWSRVGLISILFPLALLLATALWPRTYHEFFFLAAGVLCWIRSGICFKGTPLRSLMAEVVTVGGGVALVTLFGGRTWLSWAIAICLFTLVQALYFFIVSPAADAAKKNDPRDPFQRAAEEADKLLEGC